MGTRPLVVDLDGTLIRTDVLVESGLAFIKSAPLRFWEPLLWLVRGGKSKLKSRLADETNVDVATLPYDDTVVEWLKQERAAGRKIVLATASHESYAQAISDHLGLFDESFGTNDDVNLSAHHKRDRLIESYGDRGFDYAGNSHDDLAVWEAAHRAYLVNSDPGVEQVARKLGNVERVIETRPARMRVWAKAMRVHQWLKNLLIFLPLFAAHQAASIDLFSQAVIAFLAFGLCASSVYLFNDLLDVDDDRHHPRKRHRPLASGALPLIWAVVACPILLVIGSAIALVCLPVEFALSLCAYYALTLAYSVYLKRLVMVDVVVLASLYTARIVAGAFAIQAHLSFWLLAFSMFIFLSLALLKRFAELHALQARGLVKTRGRGYMSSDLHLISSLGAAAGYLSVLVLALYIQDGNTASLYRHPEYIWAACPILLYWVSRIWIIAHRGLMHDDPVVFAAKDRGSWIVVALSALIFWVAI